MLSIDELQEKIDGLIEDVGISLKHVELDILEALHKVLDYYSFEGSLRSDYTDKRLLNQINEIVYKIINNSGYVDEIEKLIDLYDEIEEVTNNAIVKHNKKVNFDKNINLSDQRKLSVDNLVTKLTSPSSLNVNLSTDLKQIIYQSIKVGVTLKEAKDTLKLSVLGKNGNGSLSRYYHTIATDTLNQYQGVVSQEISLSYGLIDWMYVGPIITTSRPQCYRWVIEMGGFLIREIVEHEMILARPTIRKGTKQFKGYSVYAIPSTASFPIIRGGHGCNHTAIPYLATKSEAQELIKKFNSLTGANIQLKYQEQRI